MSTESVTTTMVTAFTTTSPAIAKTYSRTNSDFTSPTFSSLTASAKNPSTTSEFSNHCKLLYVLNHCIKIESLLKSSFVQYDFLLVCHGGNKCCTPKNKCGIDEGDCDSDNDCEEGLKCGRDNCPDKTGNEWNKEDDCCYKPIYGKSFILL